MLATSIKSSLNKNLFLKDPEQTELNKKILSENIRLLDQLRSEAFNFRKLATIVNLRKHQYIGILTTSTGCSFTSSPSAVNNG